MKKRMQPIDISAYSEAQVAGGLLDILTNILKQAIAHLGNLLVETKQLTVTPKGAMYLGFEMSELQSWDLQKVLRFLLAANDDIKSNLIR